MKCGGFTDDGQLSRWSQNFRCTLVYRSQSSCIGEQSPMAISLPKMLFPKKNSDDNDNQTTPSPPQPPLNQSPLTNLRKSSPSQILNSSTRSLSVAQPNAAAHTKVQGSTRIVRAARVPRFHAFSCDPCIETCRKSFFPTPMSAMDSLVVMATLRFSIEGLAGC